MRIVILNVLHPWDDKRVFHKVARSLAAHGHEVTSIVPGEAPPGACHGVSFLHIKAARSLPDRFLSVFRLVRAARRVPADAFLAVEPESWVAGLLLKLLSGKPLVFDVHEYVPSEFAKFFPRPLRPCINTLTIRFMRLFARLTSHIILTKQCLDREFEGLPVPRTVVLNTNHLQPPCEAVAPELAERYRGKPTLIHQGQFGDVRGAYPLLEAMKRITAQLPGTQCILLGRYVQGDEQAYRKAVRDAGLTDHIHFIDEVPFGEVPQYIAVSAIGLILFQPIGLGHTLGMPHKMFDYMREGIPFIAPDYVIEVKRVVEEGDCALLVDVTDPDAIASAALRLLQDPGEAERLGRNGRALVESKYHWAHDEARLLEVFSALASRNAGAAEAP